MAISNYLTLSHLRKVLAALDPRFKKIESDISKTATKEYVDNNLIKNLVDGTAEGSVHSIGMSEGTDIGDYAFAEGEETEASGEDSHAEGYATIASDLCAHAEGEETEATGEASHAEGYDTTANGYYSHAEGRVTQAEGESSHSEGQFTNATGDHSHAEGYNTYANGENSHVEGEGTIASTSNQHVQGKFNVEDSSGTYADIVGNGSSLTNRSNAYTLDWSGNGWFAGKVSAGTVESPAVPTAANDLVTKSYLDSVTTGTSLAGLTDTTISSSPSNGQTLVYNSSISKWVNGSIGTRIYFTKTGNTTIDGFGQVDVYSYTVIKDGVTVTENPLSVLMQAQDILGIITNEENSENLQWLNYTGITNLGFLFTVQQFDTTATVQNVYGIYLNSNYCIGSSLPMANYQNATTSSAGLMSASDKEKLDGITLQSLTGLINELIDDALAQYGDGDTASYGYADASEEEY